MYEKIRCTKIGDFILFFLLVCLGFTFSFLDIYILFLFIFFLYFRLFLLFVVSEPVPRCSNSSDRIHAVQRFGGT